ncbi:MAG: Pyridine nucleotide-disulfide oxidoreductase [Conexibacter sp.]|nr:Pyridine nucleotide-disulfide oxidoreductase [Conexibacter sp.]
MTEPQRILIVGGGPAGLATARAYREAGGRGEVTLLAGEPHLPYRRPPLTKEYLAGEADASELPIEPASWYDEQGVVVRHERATELDRVARTVTTAAGTISYDALVLATGSRPVRLPIPGAADPAVHVMRTREDSERLQSLTGPGVRVGVIGSGFIGCEAAASLRRRGVDVVLLGDDDGPQARRLGSAAAERIADWLDEDGVELRLGAAVEQIAADGAGWAITQEGGATARVDVVLLGSGVQRNVELAEAAGLELTDAGTIATDAGLRTDDRAIFAAGDIAGAHHPRAGRRLVVEHWGEALNHGAVVGRRLAGDADATWENAPGFWSTIGGRTLKHVAWGDGFDDARFVPGENGAFTVWYGRDGITVGVLTHERDEDYERGRELVERGAALP